MSLLKRAKNLRNPKENANVSNETDIVFDPSSGISEEDQKDILSQIDEVAQKNRISASADLMVVKANKKGFVFPFIVNIAALALLAGGFLTLSAFFRQSESELRGGISTLRSAEGKLIQEIKKETEARLLAKEQEINSIQSRLKEIDSERNELQANMDARVKQKEEELRKAVEAELAEERRKLSAQGLSTAAIEERMRKLEEERNQQFSTQLASFRREAEEEKAKMEANLQKLQADFQNNLNGLNAERQKIVEDSRKREEALKVQLDEKTRALESERSKNQAELSRAESEIKTLSEQRDKAQLVENQILGFYASAKSSLNQGNPEKAREYLTSLKAYLDEESVKALPGIGRRREIDLVISESFINMIDESIRKQRETMSIAAAMQSGALVDEIRKTAAQAKEAADAGNITEAEKLYASALGKVPEVLVSHEYFIRKQREIEETRKKSLNAAVEKAENAFKAGRYKEAVELYTQAMTYMGVEQGGRGSFLQNVQKSGYEILQEEQRQLESRNAAGFLAEGNSALNTARYPQAVAAYVTLLERYPLSRQTNQALEGIKKATDQQNALLRNREASTNSTVASLQSEKAALEKALNDLQANYSQESTTTRSDYDRQIAALQSQNAQEKSALQQAFQSRIAALESQVADLKKQNEKSALVLPVPAPLAAPAVPAIPLETQAELKRLKSAENEFMEAQAELKRLKTVEKELTQIKDSYKDYAAKEDSTLKGKGSSGIVEAKLYLDSFLASESIKKNFPDFDSRIKRYDRAFQDAGRNEALMEAADIAYRLSSLNTKPEMEAYISSQLAQKKGNELMTDYLNTIQRIVK